MPTCLIKHNSTERLFIKLHYKFINLKMYTLSGLQMRLTHYSHTLLHLRNVDIIFISYSHKWNRWICSAEKKNPCVFLADTPADSLPGCWYSYITVILHPLLQYDNVLLKMGVRNYQGFWWLAWLWFSVPLYIKCLY